MNIVVIGHIDAGKSTTIGRLLYDSKSIPESKMSEIQKLVDSYKRKFEFGYFLDAMQEELEEERTIDTTRVTFTAGKNLHTVVDVPGHKEFIKNMLTGACNADAAILIVDVLKGVEEQTRRHAYLTKMLGITQGIVCINKMDQVNYEPLPFEEALDEVDKLLKDLELNNFSIMPISALNGDNIYSISKNMDWWTDLTLIETLDLLEEAHKKPQPLRIMVQGIYKGVTLARLLTNGTISEERIVFLPSGNKVTMDPIPAFKGECLELKPRDHSIELRGDIGGVEGQIKSSIFIKGEVVILEDTLKVKDNLRLRCGTAEVDCTILNISDILDPGTGKSLSNKKIIKSNQAGIVNFSTKPIVVERFSDIPELGRFLLIKNGKQIGLGIVLET